MAGEFRVAGTDAVIGIELASDLGVNVGDKLRLTTAEGGNDVVTISGIFDMGNKEVNRRWVFVTLKMAQNLLDLAGGVTNIDLAVQEIFSAETVADTLSRQTGLLVESWMQTNAQLLAALRNQTITTVIIRIFVIVIVALGHRERAGRVGRAEVARDRHSARDGHQLAQGHGGVPAAGRDRGISSARCWARCSRGRCSSLSRSFSATRVVFRFSSRTSTCGCSSLRCWSRCSPASIAAVTPARRAAHIDPVSAIRYG